MRNEQNLPYRNMKYIITLVEEKERAARRRSTKTEKRVVLYILIKVPTQESDSGDTLYVYEIVNFQWIYIYHGRHYHQLIA